VRRGWEVQSASTLQDGIALLDSKPDCVILDLMLPDGDGVYFVIALCWYCVWIRV
jgi:DNA-binding response OmpR family regulator